MSTAGFRDINWYLFPLMSNEVVSKVEWASFSFEREFVTKLLFDDFKLGNF